MALLAALGVVASHDASTAVVLVSLGGVVQNVITSLMPLAEGAAALVREFLGPLLAVAASCWMPEHEIEGEDEDEGAGLPAVFVRSVAIGEGREKEDQAPLRRSTLSSRGGDGRERAVIRMEVGLLALASECVSEVAPQLGSPPAAPIPELSTISNLPTSEKLATSPRATAFPSFAKIDVMTDGQGVKKIGGGAGRSYSVGNLGLESDKSTQAANESRQGSESQPRENSVSHSSGWRRSSSGPPGQHASVAALLKRAGLKKETPEEARRRRVAGSVHNALHLTATFLADKVLAVSFGVPALRGNRMALV